MRHAWAASLSGVAALALACGAKEPRVEVPPTESAAPVESALIPSASTPKSAFTATPPEKPPAIARTSAFPPKTLTPPVERTKKPNDGVWAPMKTPGLDPPAFAQTILHPHKIKPFVIVSAVAIDLSRVRLELIAGSEEPESDAIPKADRTGRLPESDVPLLLAATNGGFKRRHGQHGMSLGATTLVPPKPESCTLIAKADGKYAIGTWPAIESEAKGARFTRQSPACLVEGGAAHPDVDNEFRAKKWGGAEDGEKEIRRSAYALSKDGETLYFVIGDWVNAASLATALVALGVDAAMEFDINYSYTRFVLYDRDPSGAPIASSPLLPELKFSKTEYWQTPSYRDFFYLARR
jgi:hypothetical protein